MRLVCIRCICTVVGWRLHEEDHVQTAESERMLKHLPRCIYLKFENAEWRIHPTLEPGVFPLKNKMSTWVVNGKTAAKVQRKGFTLVPDFAGTALSLIHI